MTKLERVTSIEQQRQLNRQDAKEEEEGSG
jgi:hypothetical protein